jgi:hypothetical protein
MTSGPGEIFALCFLLVIAGGLVFAALYAVYGKPKTVEGQERKRHVVNGFRIGGGILLGFVLVGTFVSAVGVGFFGTNLESAPLSFSSRALALGLAAVSLTFITLIVQRWAKYFGGWIGYGALNGVLMASSGHLLNNPAIPVRRSWALMMTGIAIASALVCLRFTEDYELSLVDKIAVVGWVVCFAVAANVERYGLTAFALAGVGLVLAWFHHRLLNRPTQHARAHRSNPKAV